MKISFEARIDPRGQGRPRARNAGGFVQMYKAKADQVYEQLIRLAWGAAGSQKLSGAICAEIVAVFPVPKSASKRDRAEMLDGMRPPLKKSDVDNIAKAVLDALNGCAYDDDKQVCRLTVSKRYGETGKLLIILEEIP